MEDEYEYLPPEAAQAPADEYEYLPPAPAAAPVKAPKQPKTSAPAPVPAPTAEYEYLPPEVPLPGQSTMDWFSREVGGGKMAGDKIPSMGDLYDAAFGDNNKGVTFSWGKAADRFKGSSLTPQQQAFVVSHAERLRALGAARGRSGDKSPVDEQIAAVLEGYDPESVGIPAYAIIKNAKEIVDFYEKNPEERELPAIGPAWEQLMAGINAKGSDSGLISGTKAAVAAIPAALGGAGLSALGTKAGTSFAAATGAPAAIPAVLGGLGGALIGSLAGQEAGDLAAETVVPNEVKAALGMTEEQLALNRVTNPWSTAIGEQAANLLGAKPGVGNVTRLPDLNPALAGAGLNMAMEAGSQISEGQLDPRRFITSAGAGALMTQNRKWVDRLSGQTFDYAVPTWNGASLSDHVTYKPEAVRGSVVDDIVNGFSDADILQKQPLIGGDQNLSTLADVRSRVEAGDLLGARAAAEALPVRENNGLDTATVTDMVNGIAEGWENSPEFVIHDSPTADTVPAEMRGKDILGAYDKDTGKVHIFADRLVTESDARAVVYHEALGHAGLAFKYQNELDDLLLGLYDRGAADFKAAVDSWRKNNPQAYNNIYDPLNPPANAADAESAKRRRAAAEIEEVLAETSEQGPIMTRTLDIVGKKIREFARRAGMDHLEYSQKEIRTILGMGHTNLILGKDRATGLGGVRYIYGGLGSEEADLNQFAQASKMLKQGANPEAVRRMTGWHKADDGMWRYEISDEDFSFTPGAFEYMKQNPDGEFTVKDVFDHPALLKAYPQLGDVKVKVAADTYDPKRTTQGWFESVTNTLVLTPYAKNPIGTAIHELQHAVQEIEGFASGGDPKTATSKISDEVALTAADTANVFLDRRLKELRDRADAFDYADKDPDLAEYRKLHEQLVKNRENRQKFEKGSPERAALLDAAHDIQRRSWKYLEDFQAKFSRKTAIDNTQMRMIKAYVEGTSTTRQGMIDDIALSELDIKATQKDLREAVRYGDADLARGALSAVPEVQRQAYRNLHGEVEARDTTLRMEMSDAERRQSAPMTMEGEVSPSEYVYARGIGPSKDVVAISEEARQVKAAIDEEAEFWGIPPERVAGAAREADFRADVKMNLARKGLDQTMYERQIDAVLGVDKANDNDVRYASRGSRVDPAAARTEEFYTKHLSPSLHNDLKRYVKPLEPMPRISDEEIVARGLDLGIDIETARQWGAMPDNSDYLIALKDLMNDKAVGVQELAREMLSPKGTNEQEIELIRRITELGEIMAMFDKSRNSLGRMFRTLRNRIGELGEDYDGIRELLDDVELGDGGGLSSGEIRELARRIAAGEPAALQKAIHKFDPDYQKFADSLFYNGMFSNVQTQWNNIKGNFATLLNYMVTDVGAATVGSAKRAVGLNAPDRVLWSEVRDRFAGIGMAIANPETWRAIVREFTAPVGAAHKNRWQSQSITNQPLSMVIEHGTRGLQAADAFFRIVAETSNMYGGARRMATTEAKRKFGGDYGDTTNQAWIDRRIERIMQRPPKKLLKEVQAAADRLLYQEQLPRGVQTFTGAIRRIPFIGRMLMPIVSVTTNIIKYGAEFTTIPAFRRIYKNKPKGAALDRELARIAVGAAVTMTAVGKILEGEMTGLGPSDPNERAEWLLSHEPQSIKIGGEWYSYKSLDPLATYLTVLSDTIQTVDRGWKKRQNSRGEMSAAELGLRTVGAFSEAMISNSFVSNIKDLMSQTEDLPSAFLVSIATPFARIPFASEAEILSDEYKRDIRGADVFERVGNRFQAVDPGGVYAQDGRQGLPIQRDPLGNPLKRIHEVDMNDPVAQELGRLFTATGHTAVGEIRPKRGDVYVDKDIANKVSALMGPALNKALMDAMSDPAYATMTDEQKSRVLQKVGTRVKTQYGKLLKMELIEDDPNNKVRLLSPLKRAFATPEEEQDD